MPIFKGHSKHYCRRLDSYLRDLAIFEKYFISFAFYTLKYINKWLVQVVA